MTTKKFFGTFIFLESFKHYKFCNIKIFEVSKYVLQNTFYFCTFSNTVDKMVLLSNEKILILLIKILVSIYEDI